MRAGGGDRTGAPGPQGSPGCRPARSGPGACSPAGVALRRSRAIGLGGVGRRGRFGAGGVGLAALATLVFLAVVVLVFARLALVLDSGDLRRDRWERLGERVGQVAEHVSRV